MMVSRVQACVQTHETAFIKHMQFTVYQLHFNQAVKEKKEGTVIREGLGLWRERLKNVSSS